MEWAEREDEEVLGGTWEVPSGMYRSRSGPVKMSRTGASPYRAMSYRREVSRAAPHRRERMKDSRAEVGAAGSAEGGIEGSDDSGAVGMEGMKQGNT